MPFLYQDLVVEGIRKFASLEALIKKIEKERTDYLQLSENQKAIINDLSRINDDQSSELQQLREENAKLKIRGKKRS